MEEISPRLSDHTKPKILVISHVANLTGASIMLLNLLRHIDLDALWNTRILLREGGETEADFAELASTYLIADSRIYSVESGSNYHQAYENYAELLDEWQPDLVYSNTITNGPMVRTAQDADIPVIIHVQETKRSFLKYAADYIPDTLEANHLICVSHAVKQYLLQDFKIPQERLTVIHNSIDTDKVKNLVAQSPCDVRARLNIPVDATLIGGMGWVKLGKGVDLWLQAARRVLIEAGDSTPYFLWVGQNDNDFADEMVRNLPMMGLQGRVIFTGVVSNPYPYLNAIDIFVMSSRYESIGLVNIEAAFLRKPVVYFGCAGGPGEVIGNDAGIAADNLDAYELAQGIIQLAKDPISRNEMGTRGHEKVLSNFDVKQKAPHVQLVIEEVLSHR